MYDPPKLTGGYVLGEERKLDLGLELASKQLGRWQSESAERDANASPCVTTPPAPQRAGCSRRIYEYRDVGVNVNVTGGVVTGARKAIKPANADFAALNKDLLILSLEEDNDRLRSSLVAERRARQLAEAEAREFEKRTISLAARLAEAQQKLDELEQEAFHRAFVEKWLETVTPQRQGSVDQGPDGEGEEAVSVGSTPFAEARLSAKPASLDLAVATTPEHKIVILGLSGAAVAGSLATRSAPQGSAGKSGARDLYGDPGLDFGCNTISELHVLEDTASASAPRRDEALSLSSLHAADTGNGPSLCSGASGGACGGPAGHAASLLPEVHGFCHVSRRSAVGGAAAIACGGDGGGCIQLGPTVHSAAAAAEASGRARRLKCSRIIGNRKGGGSCDDGSGSYSLRWDFSAHVEAHRPTGLAAAAVEVPALHQGQEYGQGMPLSYEDEPLSRQESAGRVAGASQFTTTAASVWSPPSAALSHGLGLEASQCSRPVAQPQQPWSGLPVEFAQPSAASATATVAGLLAWPLGKLSRAPPGGGSAPTGSIPPRHACPALWPAPIKVTDPLRPRGSSFILRRGTLNAADAASGGSYSNGHGGGGFGGAGSSSSAAIQSYSSAPVGAMDGGEWCNIPLGSPTCQ